MKKYLITVNQTQYEVEVVELRGSAANNSKTVNNVQKTAAPSNGTSKKDIPVSLNGKKVTAPMPGNVIKLFVSPGDKVSAGQKLLVFEAMKMENDLNAPMDGIVSEVKVSEGSVIAVDELLVVIE